MSIVTRNSNGCRSHTGKTKAGETFEKFIGDKDYNAKLLLPFEAFLNASFCKYPIKIETAKLTSPIATEDCAARSLVKPAPMAVGLCLISWTNAVLPITQGMEISRLSGMWIDPGSPPQYNSGYS